MYTSDVPCQKQTFHNIKLQKSALHKNKIELNTNASECSFS
jgi:hypothetical protein